MNTGAPVILGWPTTADDDLGAAVHRIARDATAAGGAIGWVRPPGRDETDRWLGSVLADAAVGEAAFCVVEDDGVAVGFGTRRRDPEAIFRHRAALWKVTVHPGHQGRGLGRLMTLALVDSARAAGMELVHLRVRGNNHRAIALYESLGFTEYGRFPNAIAVADERFDAVWLYRELDRPSGVRLRGSA